jgi:hypothetical protein
MVAIVGIASVLQAARKSGKFLHQIEVHPENPGLVFQRRSNERSHIPTAPGAHLKRAGKIEEVSS